MGKVACVRPQQCGQTDRRTVRSLFHPALHWCPGRLLLPVCSFLSCFFPVGLTSALSHGRLSREIIGPLDYRRQIDLSQRFIHPMIQTKATHLTGSSSKSWKALVQQGRSALEEVFHSFTHSLMPILAAYSSPRVSVFANHIRCNPANWITLQKQHQHHQRGQFQPLLPTPAAQGFASSSILSGL